MYAPQDSHQNHFSCQMNIHSFTKEKMFAVIIQYMIEVHNMKTSQTNIIFTAHITTINKCSG